MRFVSIPFLAAVTPSGGGGGSSLTIVQSPAKASQGYGLTVQQTLSAVTSGNHLVVAVWGWTSAGAPTISDSAGGSWAGTQVHSVGASVGDMTIYYFIRPNITSGLTWVRATYTGAAECYIAATEVSGGTPSLDGTAGNATQSGATQFDHAFTSTANGVLFVSVDTLSDSQTATGISPVTSEGSAEWSVYSRGIFPTAGSNTASFTIAASRSGHKSWIVVKGN